MQADTDTLPEIQTLYRKYCHFTADTDTLPQIQALYRRYRHFSINQKFAYPKICPSIAGRGKGSVSSPKRHIGPSVQAASYSMRTGGAFPGCHVIGDPK